MANPHRKIIFPDLGHIYADQLVPPEFDEAVYDDILERIRLRGALDLLESGPDLGAEGYAKDRLGPPYRLTREIYERQRKAIRQEEARRVWQAKQEAARLAHEARAAEVRQAREAALRAGREAFLRAREAAWAGAEVRTLPVASGSLFTCGCGHPPVEILLPPPGWGGGGERMCGGRFMYQCPCGKETGMQSKRLVAECEALRVLVQGYGWHEGYPARALPPRTYPLNDMRVYPLPMPGAPA